MAQAHANPNDAAMVGRPIPYETVWLGATPPDGPATVGAITVGFWFEVDTAGIFCGFRYFFTAGEHGVVIGELWNTTLDTLLVSAIMTPGHAAIVDTANNWRSVWSHPRALLLPTTRYFAQIALDGVGIWRDDGLLNGPDLVAGHITVPHFAGDGVSGGMYDFTSQYNNAVTNPIGNLYGIDVLIDFGD